MPRLHALAGSGGSGAAGRTTPAISLQRIVGVPPAAVVAEQRAADVAVVGDSLAALLAAYSLAKGGRKVRWLVGVDESDSAFMATVECPSVCIEAGAIGE
jgi:hypothetical protein